MNTAKVEEHLHAIEQDGYTILENVIEPELIEKIRARVRGFERESQDERSGDSSGANFQRLRMGGLLHLDPLFWDVPIHPEVVPIVEGVLGADFLLTTLSSVDLMPGKNVQPIHPDDALIPLQRPHQPIVCTCMWAINDFTEENGATRVLPGTHRADAMPDFSKDYEGLVPAKMPAGSVLVYNGSLWHRPADNTTQEGRLGLQVSYCAGWIRPITNYPLSVPRELAAQFPQRLIEMLGFTLFAGLIGTIDNDPRVGAESASGREASTLLDRPTTG